MYTPFQLAAKYLSFWLKASGSKGHGIHSPFVFDFVTNLLNAKDQPEIFNAIESRRKELLQDNAVIDVEDFGAGSSVIKTNRRIVKKIAASSLKPKKYSQLLYRMAAYYRPQTILELGTSFGITTSYLAAGNPHAHVYTCEGASAIAGIAALTFLHGKFQNIELIKGDFTHTLPPLLQRKKNVDMAFIDGNHRKEPTLNYFQLILGFTKSSSIVIFDDIHWSREMEEAWEEIKNHPAVTCSIDLFFVGCVFFNTGFKEKQHFTIRY